MLNNILILLIAIPALTALLNIFLPVQLKKILTVAGSLATLVLTLQIYLYPDVHFLFGRFQIFSIDTMTLMALIFIQLLSFIILIFSLKGVEKSIENRFFVLYPVTVASCSGF